MDVLVVWLRTKQAYFIASSHVMGYTCPIKECVCDSFNVLIAPFYRVLMLLMWFTLPVITYQTLQNVLHFIANLYLCPVTNELGHSSLLPDIVKEDIDKLPINLHRILYTRLEKGSDRVLGEKL